MSEPENHLRERTGSRHTGALIEPTRATRSFVRLFCEKNASVPAADLPINGGIADIRLPEQKRMSLLNRPNLHYPNVTT